MFRIKMYWTAPALVMLMGGTAQAALTADQVWQSWKDAGALAGLTVKAATENSDGGVVTLNGVQIGPEGAVGLTLSDIVLTEQSDGSVLIEPGADIGANLADGETAGSVKVTHEDLTLTAREGDAGALIYDYEAAALSVAYDANYPATSFDGAAAGNAMAKGTVDLTNLAGSYSDTPGPNRAFVFAMAASKLAYDIVSEDPGVKIKTVSRNETTDVAMDAMVMLPATVSLMAATGPSDIGAALQDGFSIEFNTTQGASTGSAEQEDALFPYQMTFAAGPGQASAVFNKDRFAVRSTGEGLDIGLTSASVPIPVTLTSGPIEFGMTSPVMAAEAAGDYALTMKMSGVTLNEEAWALFDPGAALKRDPADLSVDVSGKAKLDMIALMAAEDGGMTEVTPPTLETLDIKELALKVAGAAFAGTGAFTVDNSAGVPMPIGEANVSLTGGNALIDGLIATGLITEDDAMGVRMMMGGFMTPGANPDELTSKIEAKAGGEITVNGQRVQ